MITMREFCYQHVIVMSIMGWHLQEDAGHFMYVWHLRLERQGCSVRIPVEYRVGTGIAFPKQSHQIWEEYEKNKHWGSPPEPETLPKVVDVMSSLRLDVMSAHDTFGDYCSNYDLNPNSRDALASYQQVQTYDEQLRKLLNRAQYQQFINEVEDE